MRITSPRESGTRLRWVWRQDFESVVHVCYTNYTYTYIAINPKCLLSLTQCTPNLFPPPPTRSFAVQTIAFNSAHTSRISHIGPRSERYALRRLRCFHASLGHPAYGAFRLLSSSSSSSSSRPEMTCRCKLTLSGRRRLLQEDAGKGRGGRGVSRERSIGGREL